MTSAASTAADRRRRIRHVLLPSGILQHSRHCAIAAGAFPNVTTEALVVDEGIGGPRRRREKVWPVEVGEPLERRLEAAVDVVTSIHRTILPQNRSSWST